jgi:hypothetical protein
MIKNINKKSFRIFRSLKNIYGNGQWLIVDG